MTPRSWIRNLFARRPGILPQAGARRRATARLHRASRARLHCEEFEPRTLLSIATHFSVVPSADYVQPGVPFSVTVTAADDAGHPADYLGPVHFTSHDAQATLPANYTVTAADHGTHTFSGVIIRTFGNAATQDISAGTGLGFISELVPATAHSYPEGITAGPDGNLWFTENFGNKIGNITPQGAITEFPVPSAGPHGITAGPDGNLWYTTDYINSGNHVGRITPAGTVTEFNLPTNSASYGITAGPDGNLWFTELAGKVGRITPTGTITEFNVNGNPHGITRGPDGNLWFVDHLLDKVGKITPSGVVTEFQLPQNSEPEDITAGPDGNLWFTEPGYGPNGQVPSQVGRITPTGTITQFLLGTIYHGDDIRPMGITAGPDGYLWFTEAGATKIGRINAAGVPNYYSIPTASSQPYGITRGPDGNLWFTESDYYANRVGRINLVPTAGTAVVHGADSFVVTTTAGNPDVAGTPFSVTVTAYDFPRHIDTGYHNTVHFTSSDPAATLPANYTFTAADHGVHTFSGVILRTAGSRSVTPTDSVNSHGSATVNVVAAAASRLVVSTSAANPDVAGTPFNVTVTAQDPYGNTATGYTGRVHFSSGDPYGASLPADYTFTAADQGVHTFAAGATLYTASTTTIDYANAFGDPSNLTANGNTTFPGTPPVLRLTDGGGGEASSAWYNRPVGSGAFTTTFTLQDQPVSGAADGVCFVLQSDPRGQAALGGGGGGEGYAGIANSIAIKFDLFTHGTNTSSTGLFTGGQSPDSDPTKDVPLTGH
jgi:streptogramin lyase